MKHAHTHRDDVDLCPTAPSGAPEMFETEVVGEREVVFSWSPPLPIRQNGVITSYILSCSPSPSSLPLSPSHSGSLTVAGFSPNTLYSCSLVASNSQGSGPPDTLSFTTKEDCNETITVAMFKSHFLYIRCLLSTVAKWIFRVL